MGKSVGSFGGKTLLWIDKCFRKFDWNETRGSEAGGLGGESRREKLGRGGVTIGGKIR